MKSQQLDPKLPAKLELSKEVSVTGASAATSQPAIPIFRAPGDVVHRFPSLLFRGSAALLVHLHVEWAASSETPLFLEDIDQA